MNLKEKTEKSTNLVEHKITMKKLKKQIQGITLIALVVTIIVLLILAGIAINLTIGENGIFNRAQTAANTWRNAETNEQLAMGELEGWIDGYMNGNGGNQGGGTGDGDYNTATTVADAIEQNKPFENDTTITDNLENSIRVPSGFKIAQDSATVVEDGIVIEDSDGNQFVWIPVSTIENSAIHTTLGDKTINYARTSFYGEDITVDYTESMPTDEMQSINANGGYYIGRFEAGEKEATDAKMMSLEYKENRLMEYVQENNITDLENLTEEQTEEIAEIMYGGTITIKRGQAPYTLQILSVARELAEEMDTRQGYNTATTKLVSGYAWDTAINFIQIKNSNYGTSSPEGNYINSSLFTYLDIEGNKQTGPKREIIPTGQTTAVSNIYDMGGNLNEYTTETGPIYLTVRGGSAYITYNEYSAGVRVNGNNGGSGDKVGIRVTLYLQY